MLERLPGPLRDTIDIYFNKRVARSAAALSFYLTLSVFPFLICVSAILSSFNISNVDFSDFNGFIPSGTIDIINNYLGYINANNSKFLLYSGIVVMVTSSSAAFRTLMSTMADIQGKGRFSGIWGTLLSFVMSLGLMAVIYISCIVIVAGEWLISVLNRIINLGLMAELWSSLRFVLLFLLLFLIVQAIYSLMAPKEQPKKGLILGAFLASFALVVISGIFSWFISLSVKYTLVYGSLASIIVLMVWLNVCGTILIMGNVINNVAIKYKKSVSSWVRSKFEEKTEEENTSEEDLEDKSDNVNSASGESGDEENDETEKNKDDIQRSE